MCRSNNSDWFRIAESETGIAGPKKSTEGLVYFFALNLSTPFREMAIQVLWNFRKVNVVEPIERLPEEPLDPVAGGCDVWCDFAANCQTKFIEKLLHRFADVFRRDEFTRLRERYRVSSLGLVVEAPVIKLAEIKGDGVSIEDVVDTFLEWVEVVLHHHAVLRPASQCRIA